jgi:hypothetical protein
MRFTNITTEFNIQLKTMTQEQAKKYLSDQGYGSGTNFGIDLVASIVAASSKQFCGGKCLSENLTKQQLMDFHIRVMKAGLIEEGELKWRNEYLQPILDVANSVFDEMQKETPKQKLINRLNKAQTLANAEKEYDWHVAIGGRCGTLTSYLAHFIPQMTPDQRELVAREFDKGLFDSDEAIAKRFREGDANNTSHENN